MSQWFHHRGVFAKEDLSDGCFLNFFCFNLSGHLVTLCYCGMHVCVAVEWWWFIGEILSSFSFPHTLVSFSQLSSPVLSFWITVDHRPPPESDFQKSHFVFLFFFLKFHFFCTWYPWKMMKTLRRHIESNLVLPQSELTLINSIMSHFDVKLHRTQRGTSACLLHAAAMGSHYRSSRFDLLKESCTAN